MGVFILLAVEFAGIFSSVFIIFVNVQSWMKGQKMSSRDQIIIALSFSDMVFSAVNAAIVLGSAFVPQLLSVDYIYYGLYDLMTYSICSNSWLSACLGALFFVKTTNFNIGFLAQLKMRIEMVMPWVTSGVEVFSFIIALVQPSASAEVYGENSTLPLITNETSEVIGYETDVLNDVSFLLKACLTPFMIVTVTTAHINISLCKHTQQNMDSGGPTLKVHRRAASTMTSLLILNTVFYVLQMWLGFLQTSDPLYRIGITLVCSFSLVQSIILILGIGRLKKTFIQIITMCRRKALS
ncbi:hypothetical protein XENTR_v10023605 [Xenopus tropicalis]|uniref:Taste receptor type 2 n=1 Tax=Xenopus tropicalis TaxID=8364 RepID=F7D494_XENTR|nr:hypothetical protein XENTR_v10023605 [Xenopus tropicalis]